MDFNSENIDLVLASLKSYNLNNIFVQTGILSTIGKETGFNAISEYSYRNTSNARLRQIFSTRLASYSDSALTDLKKDNVAFYEAIYGGRYGNNEYGDAYKFRGRGFNGLTFKDEYRIFGKKIGVDLVSNPDLMNDPKIASDVLAVFFKDQFIIGIQTGYMKKKIGVSHYDEIKDIPTGVKLAVQSNAGWKTDFNSPIIQEGYKKALTFSDYFYGYINSEKVIENIPVVSTIVKSLKKKKVRTGLLIGGSVIGLLGLGYAIKEARK